MEELIKQEIPGISCTDINIIINNYYYMDIPLESVIAIFKSKVKCKEWNKRKDKHYYRVITCRGYTKYVYMCKEQVECFYGNKYEKI